VKIASPVKFLAATAAVALGLIAGTALADEFFGTIIKSDAEAKTVTVVDKETGKEIVVKTTDKTEYVTKKGSSPIDYEKVAKNIEKAISKGRKGISVKVEHENAVATKIHNVPPKDAPAKN
jgi:hypothetical protein